MTKLLNPYKFSDEFITVPDTNQGHGVNAQFGIRVFHVESGLAWTDSTADTITLYRGATDPYWNYVRVRIWTIRKTP